MVSPEKRLNIKLISPEGIYFGWTWIFYKIYL